MDTSYKYVPFLMCNVTWCIEFFRNILKLQHNFGIIGFLLDRSFSGKVLKREEILFNNGKW